MAFFLFIWESERIEMNAFKRADERMSKGNACLEALTENYDLMLLV